MHVWDKYDQITNNGFPPNTCGGCGADDHYPKNNKAGGKAKGMGKGKYGRVGGVDEDEAAAEQQADDGQQHDEGGSVRDDDDADCGGQ